MKKIKYNIILLAISIIFLLNCNSSTSQSPAKVDGIPEKAIWCGGSDGGCWIEIVRVLDNKKYQLNFFNDFTGEKQDSGIFMLCDNCSSMTIDSITITKQISGYDGKNLILLVTKNDENCFLEKR